MKNYSKQREAIKHELSTRRDHPTASQIYESVQNVITNISLGTVYRNLSELAESGEILCLDVGDDSEHYDFDNSIHLHLCCKKCGKITDVPIDDSIFTKELKNYGFFGENTSFVIKGLCKKCREND